MFTTRAGMKLAARRARHCVLALAAVVACLPAAVAAPSDARPVILAAGDSEMQPPYTILVRRFGVTGRARVVYDAHPSTAISNSLLGWVDHARAMAWAHHPDATVVFLGGNEGFPLRTNHGRVACCGPGWVDAYAARVRAMMGSYRRHGAGHVYWFTLPAARSSARNRVYRAVDLAIEHAAAQFSSNDVEVIDLRRVFTPGGVYRATKRWGGRTLVVRESDGIHLSMAGSEIATDLLVQRLRDDAILGAGGSG